MVENSVANYILTVFSVTYYLEAQYDVSICRTSHISSTNVKLIVWTLYNINNFTWFKNSHQL